MLGVSGNKKIQYIFNYYEDNDVYILNKNNKFEMVIDFRLNGNEDFNEVLRLNGTYYNINSLRIFKKENENYKEVEFENE